jgi:hypothetical protein
MDTKIVPDGGCIIRLPHSFVIYPLIPRRVHTSQFLALMFPPSRGVYYWLFYPMSDSVPIPILIAAYVFDIVALFLDVLLRMVRGFLQGYLPRWSYTSPFRSINWEWNCFTLSSSSPVHNQ